MTSALSVIALVGGTVLGLAFAAASYFDGPEPGDNQECVFRESVQDFECQTLDGMLGDGGSAGYAVAGIVVFVAGLIVASENR